MNKPIGADAKKPDVGRHEKQQKNILPWLDKCRRYKMSLMVGLIGLTLSLAALFMVHDWETQLRVVNFERSAKGCCKLFENEVRRGLGGLIAVKQFFDASQFVDRNKFATFIEPLHKESQHPVTFFWAPRVLDSDRHSFEKAVQAEGYADFNIHCNSPTDSIAVITQQRDCFPVLYCCHDANWALAFDMTSRPELKKAIEKAIDIDQPLITTSAILPNGQKDWPEVFAFYPVYHKNLPAVTVEDRRLAVEGVVACAIQVDNIFRQVIHVLSPVGINMELADLSSTEGRQALYQYKARLKGGDVSDDPDEESEASGLVYTTTFDIADRTWEIRATPSSGYLDTHSVWVCWIVFSGGLLLTVLFVIQFYSMRNRTIMVEELVIDRTVQLQESVKRFQVAFKTANIAICLMDIDGRFTSVNKQMCKMCGYSEEEFLSMSINDITHPEDTDITPRFIQGALSDKIDHQRFIKRYMHKEGHILWGEVSSSIVRDAEGNPLYFISYVLDITERKQAEKALRKSEAHFKTLVETIPDLVWFKNPDGVYLFCNRRFESFFGAKEEEIVGKTDYDFLSEDKAEFFKNKDRLAIEAGKPTINEEEVTFADDGHKELLETIKTPMFNPDGSLVGVLGIARDITERKQAEEALQESVSKYRLLADNTVDCIWKMDKDLRFTYINPAAFRLFGFTPEEWIGSLLSDRCSAEEMKQAEAIITEVIQEKKEYINTFEMRLYHKDGREIDVEVIGRVLLDENGNTTGYQGTTRDITERKRAEDALLESKHRYQRLFEDSPVSLLEKDFSEAKAYMNTLKTKGISDFREYFDENPDELITCAQKVKILDVNKATLALHQAESKEELLDNLDKTFTEKSFEVLKEELITLAEGRMRFESEAEVKTLSGQHRHIDIRFSVTQAGRSNSNHTRALVAINDVTERKRVEKALQESNEKIRAISASANDAVIMIDNDGNVTFWNHAAERMFGYLASEVYERNLHELFASKKNQGQYQKVFDAFQNAVQESAIGKTLELIAYRKDGPEFPVEVSLSSVTLNGKWHVIGIIRDITERKKYEAKLEESEETFRTLYESSSDAVMLLDHEVLFDCNNATLMIFGYTNKEKFCGKHPAELSPPKQPCGTDSMILANEHIQKALKWRNHRFEWLHQKSDGTQFPCEVLLNTMILRGKKVLQAVVRDISERKDLEALRFQQEKALRDILNAIHVGVVLVDSETRKIINCNPAALKMINATEDQVIGNVCHKFICPTEMNQCSMLDYHKNMEQAETELVTIDGTKLPILKTVSRIVLSGEDFLLETFVDMSDVKKAEKELRKLSFAMEQSPNVIIVTDTNGNIEYVNPKFTKSTGYTAEEAIGQTPRILKSGEMSAESYKDLWETITSGKTWSCNFHNKKKNGALYWDKTTISPIIDETGSIVNYLAIKEDITEQMELEEKRQMLEMEMNQARKLEAVGSLAAGIAHEINTPIQFVGDNTNFLSDSFKTMFSLIETYDNLWQKANAGANIAELDSEKVSAEESADLEYMKEEIPSAIEQALDGVQRVTKIVRAMKDFAHSDQGTKSSSNINDMLESTLTVARNELKYVADVKTDLCQELPEIECYRDDLNQVFLNLLVNAAHTIADVVGDASAGKGIITVSTLRDNDNVIIKISDTGKGISQSIQDRVFDPFFSTKDVGKGSGQGLAIARKIVMEKHQGRLDFETEEGKGTTFIIRLPISIHEKIAQVT